MLQKLFPTTIYSQSLFKDPKKWNQNFQDEIFKIQKIDEEGQKWSDKNYLGGYTSYGSMHQLHLFSSTFAELEKKIRPHIFRYAKTLELDIPLHQLKVSSLWINIMPLGTTHSGHIHPLSVISGTYYVQCPRQSSAIKFEDPRLSMMMASPPRRQKCQKENLRFYQHNPEAGQIVLFESWLRHEVPPNQSKTPRISISFNYDWFQS